jgi:hypothetical protein
MAFALMAAIVGSRWYVMNTWGFVVAGTLTYILKDRIKDWLKGFFSSRTGRWLADYAVDIRDPVTGKRDRPLPRVVPLPEPLEDPARRARLPPRRRPLADRTAAKPEVVIKYEKERAPRQRAR